MKAGIYLWRNQTYIGRDAVAKAAGVKPSTVSDHLRVHGNLDRLGQGRGRHGKQVREAKPVGAFKSQREAARKLGVGHNTVSRWIIQGQGDRILAALMAADARKTRAALKDADMIDRIGRAAA